jgi:hypothetical protein
MGQEYAEEKEKGGGGGLPKGTCGVGYPVQQ